MTWADIELNKKLFKNIDEDALTSTFAGLENAFVNEAGGISRFPGLKLFCDFQIKSDIHIGRYNNDMIAVSLDGRTYRVNTHGDFKEIEGARVLGGERISFARTRNGLLMAGGSQIIHYNGVKNSILSKDAPISSWIGFTDGYVLAVEKQSGRFQLSKVNDNFTWDPLDTFAVDGSPDNINALLITPFNEILLTGEESIEQYERSAGGLTPFYRRWSTGDGVSEPWTLCHADNASWCLNSRYEFSRISGQTGQSVSGDIQKEIEEIYSFQNLGNLDRAWAAPLNVKGQKFIIFQSPKATNKYGSEGFTGIYDIRRNQWFQLYDWDSKNGVPDLWRGRSIFNLWGKTFVGSEGKIYELDNSANTNDGETQRVYIKTGHYESSGTIRIDAVKFTLKRGVGSYEKNPKIMFRSNPDNKGFGNYQYRELGFTGAESMIVEFGNQGTADTWQFEITVTDDCPVEIRRMQIDATKVMR